jgi:hypothetical protein
MLAACSGGAGSSSAIPGGSSASAPMAHHGYHLVNVGARKPQTCTSPYYICYITTPGSTEEFGWCLSTSGNCTSGLYAGKVNWKTTACAPNAAQTDGPTGCNGRVKSKFGPPATQVGLIYDTVTTKASVHPGTGTPQYDATWTAVVKSGSIKGDSFVEPTGVIVEAGTGS